MIVRVAASQTCGVAAVAVHEAARLGRDHRTRLIDAQGATPPSAAAFAMHGRIARPRSPARPSLIRAATGQWPASSQSFARPQVSERTAPSAPVNPSGCASGVLRFAPEFRVTGAESVDYPPT
jgi:hypothetical protein